MIHCLPTNYRLDLGEEIKDPRNIYGENLSVNILLGMVPDIQFKNLSTVIENAHLEIAEKPFPPMRRDLPAWSMTKRKSAPPLWTLAAAPPIWLHSNTVIR